MAYGPFAGWPKAAALYGWCDLLLQLDLRMRSPSLFRMGEVTDICSAIELERIGESSDLIRHSDLLRYGKRHRSAWLRTIRL